MKDCCSGPEGADLKLFRELEEILKKVESRPDDRLLMDLSVPTKSRVLGLLIREGRRLEELSQFTGMP